MIKRRLQLFIQISFLFFSPPQDEEIDVLEPNYMAKRERSGFKTFKQTKRGENSCSACSSHENSNPVEQNICQRKMFFVFLWVWKKEKILSSHKESIFRPRALMLYHWATETLRLSPLRSSYMIRVLHTARVSRAQNLLFSPFYVQKICCGNPGSAVIRRGAKVVPTASILCLRKIQIPNIWYFPLVSQTNIYHFLPFDLTFFPR